MKILTNLKQRWQAETPVLFRRVRNASVTVGLAAGAVWGANTSMSLDLAPAILAVCKYAITLNAVIACLSQMTTTNPTKTK